MNLKNDIVLITGGAQGSGAAHSRAFIREGARVVITDVVDEIGMTLAEELGDRAIYVHLDVSDEASWERAVARAQEAFGTISVLVNNAGVVYGSALENYSLAEWNRVISIDLTGTFLGMKHVAAGMKAARRGSIINISSMMGQRGSAGSYSYVAAKWGVRGLTKSAAIELGGHGVRVNAVLPGFIETAMTSKDDVYDLEIPLRRSATPEELSGTILYLASDASSFTTGAEISVDGGQSANIPRYDATHGFIMTGRPDSID